MQGPICTEGPVNLANGCKEEEGETLVDACPTGGEACDVGDDIIIFLYAGAGMTCEELKAYMSMGK